MKSLLAPWLAAASLVLPVSVWAGPYADAVIDYQPGEGYLTEFPSGAGITNAAAALGEPSRQTADPTPVWGGTFPVDPFGPPYRKEQLVSIGAGGSLTVRFDTPIQNDPTHPFGIDFIVFGSSGFSITNGNYAGGGITDGTVFGNDSETTRVSVSPDNVTYYPLNSALAPVLDTYFPTDGSGTFTRPVNPGLGAADFSGQDLAGIRRLYAGSAGGTGFDLAWAQNQAGQNANLDSIRYVRIEVLDGHVEVDGLAAVGAVPEPSVWTLLALGAGCGWGWYRRNHH